MPDATDQFYSVVTRSGGLALSAALASGEPLVITHLAIGDGEIVPIESLEGLVAERWRGICSRALHAEEAGWVELEVAIPEEVGGFMMREVAAYAGETLLAVGAYPPTYLPMMPSGARKTVSAKMVIEITQQG